MILRRTVVYIDAVIGEHVICTVSGVDLPAMSAHVWREDFPESIRPEVAAGKTFFAQANLNAAYGDELAIECIEDHWGESGSWHFEDGSA